MLFACSLAAVAVAVVPASMRISVATRHFVLAPKSEPKKDVGRRPTDSWPSSEEKGVGNKNRLALFFQVQHTAAHSLRGEFSQLPLLPFPHF